MSRIVKSISVVDDRPHQMDDARARAEAGLMDKTVLKGNAMNGYGASYGGAQQFSRDGLLDEINRLRVEADEVRAEIRKLNAETEQIEAGLEAARAEAEAAKKKRDEYGDDILDDDIFQSRIDELENMTAQAEKQAAEIVEAAHAQAEDELEKARAQGYEDGLIKGMQEAKAAFEDEAVSKLTELTDMITSLSEYGPELMRGKELEFAELATAIAGKVIGREIKEEPKYIIDMLRESVQKNQRESYITITVSPDMLPAEMKAADEIAALIEGMTGNINVYVEKNAAEGTCVMETPGGVVDMSIGTQLGNINEAFREYGESAFS